MQTGNITLVSTAGDDWANTSSNWFDEVQNQDKGDMDTVITNVLNNSHRFNNNSNEENFLPNYAVAAVTICFLLVSLSGNAISITSFIKYRELKTATGYCYFNISWCGILTSILCILQTAIVSLYGRFNLHGPLCAMLGYLSGIVNTSHTTSLVLGALDRYIAAKRTLTYSTIVKRKTLLMSLGISWVYGFAVVLPALTKYGTNPWSVFPPVFSCSVQFLHTSEGSIFTYCMFVFGFAIPVIVMVFAYWNIFYIYSLNTQVNPRLSQPSPDGSYKRACLGKQCSWLRSNNAARLLFLTLIQMSTQLPHVIVTMFAQLTTKPFALPSSKTLLSHIATTTHIISLMSPALTAIALNVFNAKYIKDLIKSMGATSRGRRSLTIVMTDYSTNIEPTLGQNDEDDDFWAQELLRRRRASQRINSFASTTDSFILPHAATGEVRNPNMDKLNECVHENTEEKRFNHKDKSKICNVRKEKSCCCKAHTSQCRAHAQCHTHSCSAQGNNMSTTCKDMHGHVNDVHVPVNQSLPLGFETPFGICPHSLHPSHPYCCHQCFCICLKAEQYLAAKRQTDFLGNFRNVLGNEGVTSNARTMDCETNNGSGCQCYCKCKDSGHPTVLEDEQISRQSTVVHGGCDGQGPTPGLLSPVDHQANAPFTHYPLSARESMISQPRLSQMSLHPSGRCASTSSLASVLNQDARQGRFSTQSQSNISPAGRSEFMCLSDRYSSSASLRSMPSMSNCNGSHQHWISGDHSSVCSDVFCSNSQSQLSRHSSCNSMRSNHGLQQPIGSPRISSCGNIPEMSQRRSPRIERLQQLQRMGANASVDVPKVHNPHKPVRRNCLSLPPQMNPQMCNTFKNNKRFGSKSSRETQILIHPKNAFQTPSSSQDEDSLTSPPDTSRCQSYMLGCENRVFTLEDIEEANRSPNRQPHSSVFDSDPVLASVTEEPVPALPFDPRDFQADDQSPEYTVFERTVAKGSARCNDLPTNTNFQHKSNEGVFNNLSQRPKLNIQMATPSESPSSLSNQNMEFLNDLSPNCDVKEENRFGTNSQPNVNEQNNLGVPLNHEHSAISQSSSTHSLLSTASDFNPCSNDVCTLVSAPSMLNLLPSPVASPPTTKMGDPFAAVCVEQDTTSTKQQKKPASVVTFYDVEDKEVCIQKVASVSSLWDNESKACLWNRPRPQHRAQHGGIHHVASDDTRRQERPMLETTGKNESISLPNIPYSLQTE